MSAKPYDADDADGRVSFGAAAVAPKRRSGADVARPGHFSALAAAAASTSKSSASAKAGRRAVRAKVKPLLPDRKD